MPFPVSPRAFSAAALLFSPLLLLSLTACARAQETPPAASGTTAQLFSDSEKARIIRYWNAPGRYVVGVRAGEKDGPVVVRLTPEASIWLRAYNNALRPGKQPPTEKRVTPVTDTDTSKAWEAWVVARLEQDRWAAQTAADVSNAQLAGAGAGAGSAPAPVPAPAPEMPGVIPPGLLLAAGNPPPLAAPVLPRRYTVTFNPAADSDSETPTALVLVYTDNIALGSSRNAYYRFSQGVISFGRRLREWDKKELDSLFGAVGLTPFERNVVKAVSVLEGGFDSVNTYDTGYVSVGFIQFATLGGGAGSLGAVVKQEKETMAGYFARDFQRFGVDVDDTGTLVVVDPATGAELRGAAAVSKIIDDKRLIAVFQRAGRTRAFQIAQIRVAKQRYYPAGDSVTVTIKGREQTVKVSDIIHSEAGMATLFDRKVNTGSLQILGESVTELMRKHGLTAIAQVVPYERELIPMLRWRTDFLADPSLTQPK